MPTGPSFSIDDLHVVTPDLTADEIKGAEEMAQFIALNGTVCPYAAKAALKEKVAFGAVRNLASRNTGRILRQASSAYDAFLGSDAESLVLVQNDEPSTHDEGDLQARNFFRQMNVHAGIKYGEGGKSKVQAEWGRLFTEPYSVIRPEIEVRERNVRGGWDLKNALFVFAQNSLYDSFHFRYAPVTSIVLNYGKDIARVMIDVPQAAVRIQTEIFDRASVAMLGKKFSDFGRIASNDLVFSMGEYETDTVEMELFCIIFDALNVKGLYVPDYTEEIIELMNSESARAMMSLGLGNIRSLALQIGPREFLRLLIDA